MDALLIGVGQGGAEAESQSLETLLGKMALEIEKWRFFVADGASVNSGCHEGIPELVMRRHPKANIHFLWCIMHILNLCFTAFANKIAEMDCDIYGEISRITSYLNINKMNFRTVLREIGAEDVTLIAKGERGRFASFCAPVGDLVDRWPSLQSTAEVMVADCKEKKQQKQKPAPKAKPAPAPPAKPARCSSRATRCVKNMGCDLFAEQVECTEAKRMDCLKKQLDEGRRLVDTPPSLSIDLVEVDEQVEYVKVPKKKRWSYTLWWLNDEKRKQWCLLLNRFHEEFFLPACAAVNNKCPLVPFHFRGILNEWHVVLQRMSNGSWGHHHPNSRSEEAFRSAAGIFEEGLDRARCWLVDPFFLSPALLDNDSQQVAKDMLKNRQYMKPRDAELDEILSDPTFWVALEAHAKDGACTEALECARQKLYSRWSGKSLHSILVEQTMSVLRRYAQRCLNAHLPHQRRHLRRVNNKTLLQPEMVEKNVVAYEYWNDALGRCLESLEERGREKGSQASHVNQSARKKKQRPLFMWSLFISSTQACRQMCSHSLVSRNQEEPPEW